MASRPKSSPAEQAQAGVQVTAPVSQNAVLVDSVNVVATANDLDIISRGNEYDPDGKMSGKHFARVRYTPPSNNEELNSLIDQINQASFLDSGDFVFIICEEDKPKLIESIDNGTITSVSLKISLREIDAETTGYSIIRRKDDDENKEIARKKLANARKELEIQEKELEARASLADAKLGLFKDTALITSVLKDSVLAELQMKF